MTPWPSTTMKFSGDLIFLVYHYFLKKINLFDEFDIGIAMLNELWGVHASLLKDLNIACGNANDVTKLHRY